MIESTQVVVVGAGPAGSTAAEHAALKGADVVLIERREEIGVPVRCGELLPSVEEISRIFPNTENLRSLFEIPEGLISREIETIRLWSPKGRLYEVSFSAITTDRDRFDQYLASRAERAGATIIRGCECTSVDGNKVLTSKGTIESKVIIGADGPLSRVGRSVGIPRARCLCPAVTSQVKGEFDSKCDMFFGSVAPGAYAWIIPKKEGANVGLGIAPGFAKESVKEYFRRFAESRGFETERITGKYVPMSGPVKTSVVGNTLVVGDAAGHVMPVNGGGIPIAMICGRIAGKAAAKTAMKGAPLESYERLWKRQVEASLRTGTRSKGWADLCWGSNWRLEMAMTVLGRRRMGNLIRCKSMFP
jgi:digeranylgeranylglycerophospholipid reductase